MKQKYVWLTFLISIFTLVPYRIYQRVVLGQSAGKVFGIGKNDVGVIAMFLVFVLLIIIMIRLLKNSEVNIILKKNTLTGVWGVASGVCVLVSSLVQLTHTIPLLMENKGKLPTVSAVTQHRVDEVKEFINSQISIQNITIIRSIFGIVAFAGLIFIAMLSLQGENKFSKFKFIYILPSLWSIAYLFNIFAARFSLVAETVDLFDVVSCVFLMMFLFMQAKFLFKIKDSNLNKKLLRYGLLAVLSMFAYSVPNIVNLISTGTLTPVDFWTHLSNIVLALYIAAFLFDSRNNVEEILELDQEDSSEKIEQNTLEDQENEPAVDVEMFHVNDMIDKLEGFYT